jgi:hypothetical protein
MKKIFIALTVLAVVASSCNQNRREQNNVTIENNTTAGFDVNKLAQFVKTSTDPETLEKAINNPANQINANNQADLAIQGNPSYVGYNNYYHSSFSFTDFLLLSYIMRPHAYYMPMYHYGYYPSYYTRVHTYSTFRPTTSSYMSSRMSRSSLSSPMRSQRSFSTRRSSSFGSHSSSSRSSFGRRSFGSSRGFGRRR